MDFLKKGIRVILILVVTCLMVFTGISIAVSSPSLAEQGTLSITYSIQNLGNIDWDRLATDYSASIGNNYARFEITYISTETPNWHLGIRPGAKCFAIIAANNNTFTLRVEGNANEILRAILPTSANYIYNGTGDDIYSVETDPQQVNALNYAALQLFSTLQAEGILSGTLAGDPIYRSSLIDTSDEIYVFNYGFHADDIHPAGEWNSRIDAGGTQVDPISLSAPGIKYGYLLGHMQTDNWNWTEIKVNGSRWLYQHNIGYISRNMPYFDPSIDLTLSGYMDWSSITNDVSFAAIASSFDVTQPPQGTYYTNTINPIGKDEILTVHVKNPDGSPIASKVIDDSTEPDLHEADVTGGIDLDKTYSAPAGQYFYKMYLRSWPASGKCTFVEIQGLRADTGRWELIAKFGSYNGTLSLFDTYDFFESDQKLYSQIRVHVREEEPWGAVHYEYKLWYGQYQEGAKVTIYGHGTNNIVSEKMTNSEGASIFGLDPSKTYDIAVDGTIYQTDVSVPGTVDITIGPANQPPVASFTYSPANPVVNQTITFDASRSDDPDPDGKIVKYEWDWDSDGTYDNSTTLPIIKHSFDSAGDHVVTLRVTDDQGATGTHTEAVVVSKARIYGRIQLRDGTAVVGIPVYVYQEGVSKPIWSGTTQIDGSYDTGDLSDLVNFDQPQRFYVEVELEDYIVKIFDCPNKVKCKDAPGDCHLVRFRSPKDDYMKLPLGPWPDIVVADDDITTVYKEIHAAYHYVQDYDYKPKTASGSQFPEKVNVYVHTSGRPFAVKDPQKYICAPRSIRPEQVWHEYCHSMRYQLGMKYGSGLDEGWAFFCQYDLYRKAHEESYSESENWNYCKFTDEMEIHKWGKVYRSIFHDIDDGPSISKEDDDDFNGSPERRGENAIWKIIMGKKVENIKDFYSEFVGEYGHQEAISDIYATHGLTSPYYQGKISDLSVDYRHGKMGETLTIEYQIENTSDHQLTYSVWVGIWPFIYGNEVASDVIQDEIKVDAGSRKNIKLRWVVSVYPGFYHIYLILAPQFFNPAECLAKKEQQEQWIDAAHALLHVESEHEWDPNEDGKIDIKDAKLAAEFALGLTTLTQSQQEAADVVLPPGVDARDVVRIAEVALGIRSGFESEGASQVAPAQGRVSRAAKLSIEGSELTPNGTVRISAASVISGIQVGPQGSLSFDPHIIKIKEIRGVPPFQVLASEIDNEVGRAKFMAIALGEPRGGEIIELEVEAVGHEGESTVIKLTPDMVLDAEGNELRAEAAEGRLTLGRAMPLRVDRILSIPNPVNQGNVRFVAEGQGIKDIQVRIYDLSGREVFTSGWVAGNTLEWDLMSNRGRHVANGVYLYIVTVRGFSDGELIKSRVKKLVVLR